MEGEPSAASYTNRSGSLRRLANFRRKLEHNHLIERYAEIIEKQKAEGIVEVADKQPSGTEFYIPHNPVVREGAETVEEALQHKEEAIALFQDATFTPHKWHSNAAELEGGAMADSSEKTFAKEQLGTPHGGAGSLLGLAWDRGSDEISVSIPREHTPPTKREILRKLAKIYDPLGLGSPLTLKGKLLYREACNTKLAWGLQLPSGLTRKWTRWENRPT